MSEERTYEEPGTGSGAGSEPIEAPETIVVSNEQETLDEMNSKLDAILAAINGKEE